MHTAVRLNELILEHSSESQLILLNLPKPPVGKDGQLEFHFLFLLSVVNELPCFKLYKLYSLSVMFFYEDKLTF